MKYRSIVVTACLPWMIAAAMLAAAGDAVSAIRAPEAPPELPDTLKSFRTETQLREQEEIVDEDAPADAGFEKLEVSSAPFVPGDDAAGVVRMSGEYVPAQVLGVPGRGALIVRFFDLEGIPWDIDSVRLENPGFSAEITASPSELLVKQGSGAATTSMAVNLRGYPEIMVFTLRPARLSRGGVPVTTMLQSVRVRSTLGDRHYVRPEELKFPEPNPAASTVKFADVDCGAVEDTLLNVARSLKGASEE